jgi:hypothetical protein
MKRDLTTDEGGLSRTQVERNINMKHGLVQFARKVDCLAVRMRAV